MFDPIFFVILFVLSQLVQTNIFLASRLTSLIDYELLTRNLGKYYAMLYFFYLSNLITMC